MQTSETIHPEKQGAIVHNTVRPVGQVQSVENNGGEYLFHCEDGNVGLRFLSPSVFRLRVFRTDVVEWTSTPGVISQLDGSVTSRLTTTASEFVISTSEVTLSVSRASFALAARTALGETFYQLQRVDCNSDGRTTLVNASALDHHFYGLGEKTSFLDKQGESYTMWNSDVYAPHNPEIEALYVSVPFAIHKTDEAIYGLFLDNPGKTVFDMRNDTTAYRVTTYTGEADVYVISGGSIKDIVRTFTAITGRLHLPPAWSLGYHQSRYSYMDETEVGQLAATFRDKQIPCDVIHLDIHYMNGYRVFTFDPVRFPNPDATMEKLRQQGFHVVPIVDPGVKRDPDYAIYQHGIAGDRFCKTLEGDLYYGDVWPGSSTFPDFTDDEVAKWWGQEHRFYVDLGIKGIWNDMNEPAVFNEIKTMDPDVMHRNNGRPMTHEQLHNLYGLLMTKATYEGMRELLNGERPFVLTRAGYAGVGRYAAVWTGDNRSFWEHMEMAVPMLLNMGLSGMPFAGPDIGGFAHHTNRELLARWTQMGAFFPFARNHSALDTVRQEPWAFGSDIEDICRKYLELRYQWLPYIYTLFYETSQTGLPIIRPLLLEYPDDQAVANLSDEFLLGTDILVAPIFRPGVTQRLVYLPEGDWFDYWTGEKFGGKQSIIVQAPLDTMPIFIKSGAIIPSHPIQQHVDFSSVGQVAFTVYGLSSNTNAYVLYEDDGVTLAHETGAYNLFEVSVTRTGPAASIEYHLRKADYETHYKTRRFVVKHVEDAARCTVKHLGRLPLRALDRPVTGWAYDADGNEIIIQVDGSETDGVIEFVWE